MIGAGLKKLADSYGMKVDRGVAYGEMSGFAATFFEGNGYKEIRFSTLLQGEAQQRISEQLPDKKALAKKYRVREIRYDVAYIAITFNDSIGTMKRISAFIDLFVPILKAHGATDANICTVCGEPIESGCWKLLDDTAYHMHTHCASDLSDTLERTQEESEREDTGTYARGLVGALLGAALGAVVWAIVYALGYIASIAGLLIGFLAEKGYEKISGKRGKGKIAVLIIAIIFGVLLGLLLGYAAIPVILMLQGEIPSDLSYLPRIFRNMVSDPEIIKSFAGDSAIGLLYAFLGTFGSLIAANKALKRKKVEDLK